MYASRPNNRLPSRTRYFQPFPRKRRSKDAAQVVIHLFAVDVVTEDLLRRPVVEAVGGPRDFEGDAAGLGVPVEGLEVETTLGVD